MLSTILSSYIIDRVEAINSKNTEGDRLQAYLNTVQSCYGIDTASKHWTYQRHMQAHNEGMPSVGEIIDYLAERGIGRYK